MSDEAGIQRSRLALAVQELWGRERTSTNSSVIDSASQALARINQLTPEATQLLDNFEPAETGNAADA